MTQEIKPKSSLEIVQEMRYYVYALVDSGYPAVFNHDVFVRFADDLEEAIMRERETVTSCHGMDAPQPVTVRNPLFNAAKLRETLERELKIHIGHNENLDAERVRAALAAPPRNCDLFSTAHDAMAYYLANVSQETGWEFCKWLFDTAAQERGDHADAAKRERATNSVITQESEKLSLRENASKTADSHVGVGFKTQGNAAKLREALEKALMAFYNVTGECLPECAAALAAPARNCDRFATEEDANAAFDKMCDLRGDGLLSCIGCKYNGGERGGLPSISRCRVAWLFDTATPEEGGGHAED